MNRRQRSKIPTRQRRSGFTLVELSTTITLGGVLMTLAIGVVHQAMTFASIARDRNQTSQSTNRLMRQFREDAHRASNAEIDDAQTLLLTISSASQVTYTSEPQGVRRIEQLKDATYSEFYSMGNRSRAVLEQLKNPERVLLEVHPNTRIEISKNSAEEISPVVDRRVVAVVGSWQFILRPQENSP